MAGYCRQEMSVIWEESRCRKCCCEQNSLNYLESLHKGIYFIWGGQPETYTLLEGLVRLHWAETAVTEKLGEKETCGEAPKQCQLEKEPNREPKRDSQLCQRTRREWE